MLHQLEHSPPTCWLLCDGRVSGTSYDPNRITKMCHKHSTCHHDFLKFDPICTSMSSSLWIWTPIFHACGLSRDTHPFSPTLGQMTTWDSECKGGQTATSFLPRWEPKSGLYRHLNYDEVHFGTFESFLSFQRSSPCSNALLLKEGELSIFWRAVQLLVLFGPVRLNQCSIAQH